MPLTAGQLAELRSWVPPSWDPEDEHTDAALGVVFDRVGSVARAALELTRRFRALLVGRPDSMNVPGEYSEGRSSALALLSQQERQLTAIVASETSALAGTDGARAYPLQRVGRPGR